MSALAEGFSIFISRFTSFCNSILSVLSYIGSILKTLWFGITSLLSGLWNLIEDVLGGSVFDYVSSAFVQLSYYIGTPGVIFVSSLFLIVLIRIIIAFVFKLFRLNIDYHNTYNKNRTLSQHSSLK